MSDRFTEFLASLVKDTYPEPPSGGHDDITARVLPGVVARCPAGARVLDVGCGQGVALKHFKELGCDAWGVTTNATDREECLAKGFSASLEDMHNIYSEHQRELYDLIWARHVLEHSPAPLFALHEFKRVLKPGGLLYAEMPAPDTSCHHELNQNHYSVLGRDAWGALLCKAGFSIIEERRIDLMTPAGPDMYFSFLCRK